MSHKKYIIINFQTPKKLCKIGDVTSQVRRRKDYAAHTWPAKLTMCCGIDPGRMCTLFVVRNIPSSVRVWVWWGLQVPV